MKTIACPTDFSKCSVNSIEYAAGLASTLKAEVILMHVYETPTLYSDVPLKTIQRAEEDLKSAVTEKLKQLREKLLKKFKDLKVKTVVMEGVVSEQVAEYAKRNEVDMIITGKTGASQLKRMILGSTAARIIHATDCPVLCIPAETTFREIKKIVFATDLHEDNIGSALAITPFAKHFDAEIIFVYVDDRHLIHSDEKILEMTNKIKRRIKYPKLSGYISKNTSVVKGLEYFLEKNKADMLVMFTHRKHFPGAIFNQSITKLASHQTKIPLLALKVEDIALNVER